VSDVEEATRLRIEAIEVRVGSRKQRELMQRLMASAEQSAFTSLDDQARTAATQNLFGPAKGS